MRENLTFTCWFLQTFEIQPFEVVFFLCDSIHKYGWNRYITLNNAWIVNIFESDDLLVVLSFVSNFVKMEKRVLGVFKGQ